MDTTDGISLMVGGSAVGAIVTLLGAWIKARYAKTEISPDPINVRMGRDYMTCDECKQHRDAMQSQQIELFGRVRTNELRTASIDGQLTQIAKTVDRIDNKLDSRKERV